MKTATMQAIDCEARAHEAIRLHDEIEKWRNRFFCTIGALVVLVLADLGILGYAAWLSRGIR